jgi:hypothetical protein
MTGFFKKLKNTAEKSLEKSAEFGTKGFDSVKESAKKGYDKAKQERNSENLKSQEKETNETSQNESEISNSSLTRDNPDDLKSEDNSLKILKLRFAKGEISKEEYEKMRKLLE